MAAHSPAISPFLRPPNQRHPSLRHHSTSMDTKTLLLSAFSAVLLFAAAASADDGAALLALKNALDTASALPWVAGGGGPCGVPLWSGVRRCDERGRVTKLVLERRNLTGELTIRLLSPLQELRVLSFQHNSLSGEIPADISAALPNLKSLYLGDNRFTGGIPPAIATLHRLQVLALSDNRFSGEIPAGLAALPRLHALLLDANNLTGEIPAFAQQSLVLFNVSGNGLSGPIPATRTLSQFPASSFAKNLALCGDQVGKPCPPSPEPSASPSQPLPVNSIPPPSRRSAKVAIIAGSVAGAVVLAILLVVIAAAVCRRRSKQHSSDEQQRGAPAAPAADKPPGEAALATASASAGARKGTFSWEQAADGIGKLVFCGSVGEMYSLEELLRASAETLGRGTAGSTYKAVMETGFIVTVKRLRETSLPAAGAVEAFARRAEELGAVRHPNLVPLRAYFQARDERLLVYDYFPNGSLQSLLHGSRPSAAGRGKPLHWTSCLKIAEDTAAGLAALHAAGVAHGNLKPSNILLGPDFESCLTDFGLVPSLLPVPTPAGDSSAYRPPETRHPNAPDGAFSPAGDLYSFGILLLELLTGKTPPHDLIGLHAEELPNWVRAAREEESESGGEATSASASASGAPEEKLSALVGIAAQCCPLEPERRPAAAEVLRMVREARAEAMSSSNSSDGRDGRWSDAAREAPRPEIGAEAH